MMDRKKLDHAMHGTRQLVRYALFFAVLCCCGSVYAEPAAMETELTKAIKAGDTAAAKRQIESGANVNARNGQRRTPLMVAAEKGDLEIVRLLVASGTPIDAKDPFGRTALMFAVEQGNAGIVKFLIDSGADTKKKFIGDDTTLLAKAASRGYIDVAKCLIDAHVRIHEAETIHDEDSALWAAVKAGRPEMVKLLLDYCAFPVYSGDHPKLDDMSSYFTHVYLLICAAEEKNQEILRLLIDKCHNYLLTNNAYGTQPQKLGDCLLVQAAADDHIGIVKLLIEKKAQISRVGFRGQRESALAAAARNGNTEIVRFLIGAGANVDDKDQEGFTALMWAAYGGNLEIVKLLHEACADLDAKSEEGGTALDYAEDDDVVKFLRSAGASHGKNRPKGEYRKDAANHKKLAWLTTSVTVLSVPAAVDIAKEAERGSVRAQYKLGIFYKLGNDVPKDPAKAVEWFRKAAEQGDADAQCYLGYCYDEGVGVPKDPAKAVEWTRKAAEQGNACAQSNLGECYEYGKGVPKDLVKAKEWYQKAAEQGFEPAKKALENLR